MAERKLTTNAGAPVVDDQDVMTGGRRGRRQPYILASWRIDSHTPSSESGRCQVADHLDEAADSRI